jgi:hypothetical protein
MTTIRVDSEVYAWIQSLAIPLEDTPNSVLRRVANIQDRPAIANPSDSNNTEKRENGKSLAKLWNVPVKQSLYSFDGRFYNNLKQFPGGLFDPSGYIVFQNENDYRSCRYLGIGERLNVIGTGISAIPGYIRMG